MAATSEPGWLPTSRSEGIDRCWSGSGGSRSSAAALRRAVAAHGEHEKRAGGQYDENWPDWYAEYIVREQAGEQLPS